MASEPADTGGQRREQRLRSLKAATIVCGKPEKVLDCVDRNISKHGARLEVASQVGILDDLQLIERSGKSHCARVVWRKMDRLGIAFTDGRFEGALADDLGVAKAARYWRYRGLRDRSSD